MLKRVLIKYDTLSANITIYIFIAICSIAEEIYNGSVGVTTILSVSDATKFHLNMMLHDVRFDNMDRILSEIGHYLSWTCKVTVRWMFMSYHENICLKTVQAVSRRNDLNSGKIY